VGDFIPDEGSRIREVGGEEVSASFFEEKEAKRIGWTDPTCFFLDDEVG
jgi:hypothetical protein